LATDPAPRDTGPRVPIANLYYLLCYALNRLELRDEVPVAALQGATPSDLLAVVLTAETRRLRLRGVPLAYRVHGEDTRAPRGRIALGETMGRALVPQGRVHCDVSELTADVPFNRALKAGLRALAGHPRVDPARRQGLRRHVVAFGEVADVQLTEATLAAAATGRAEALHRRLLGLLQLVLLGLPERANAGDALLPDFFGNPQAMGRLFEDFFRSFLSHEQTYFDVRKRRVPWEVETTMADRALLPAMEGDALLTAPGRRVLVECKFAAHTFSSRQGGAPKLRSEHLYQLGTYLTHLRRSPGPAPLGVLVYAQVERPFNLHYRLDGNDLHVRTIDLAQPWCAVHAALLAMAEEWH
jgi:5-methylcytosine-specific restriction enzyme subunit McrC